MRSLNNNLTNVVLMLGLFLPAGNTVSLLVNAILPLILLLGSNETKYLKIEFASKILALIILISFVGNYLILHYDYNFKSIARGINLLMLFVLFPLRTKNLSNKVILSSIFLILLSQLAFVLNISVLLKAIDFIYPYRGSEVYYTTKYITAAAGRFGGIYRNPNQCSRYISFLFITFAVNHNRIDKIFYWGVILTCMSLILCGSRTGFIVFLLFNIIYLINHYGLIKILPILVPSMFMFLVFKQSYSLKFRVLELDTAVKGSFSQKVEWFFVFYDRLSNPFRMMFGHGSSELLPLYSNSIMLDSEWGEFFFNLGFVGCISYVFFIVKCFTVFSSRYRVFFIFLLWAISSTVVFSFRMSFLFLLIVSHLYNRSTSRSSC